MTDTHFTVLDEQKFGAFHWRAILVTGLGVFCDGYDISSIALVLTSVLASYHVGAHDTPILKGYLAAAALVGSMLGAVVFGMGPRTLRAETSAAAAVTLVQYEFGAL